MERDFTIEIPASELSESVDHISFQSMFNMEDVDWLVGGDATLETLDFDDSAGGASEDSESDTETQDADVVDALVEPGFALAPEVAEIGFSLAGDVSVSAVATYLYEQLSSRDISKVNTEENSVELTEDNLKEIVEQAMQAADEDES